MKVVGTRLKEMRLQKGLSLRELAKQAHMSHSFIADIEAGRSNPSLDTLETLAKTLNVSVDYLLGRTDDPRPIEEIVAEKQYIPGTSVKGTLRNRYNRADSLSSSSQSDNSTPSWWYRDTPPTEVELEEFLKTANIYFDGAPLDEDDKEDILTYLRVKWEREKRKKAKKKEEESSK